MLQIISGFITPNEGSVQLTIDNKIAEEESKKDHVSLASPYLQLIEDFTPIELVKHVSLFKPFQGKLSPSGLLQLAELDHARNKYIKHFSSGMKQRLRLALAVLADTPVLLLDEPLSNLDRNAVTWYRKMIDEHAQHKTVIVCSNAIEEEFYFCDKRLDLQEFKPVEKARPAV